MIFLNSQHRIRPLAFGVLLALLDCVQAQEIKAPSLKAPTLFEPLTGQVLAMRTAPEVGLIGALETNLKSAQDQDVSLRIWNEAGKTLWQKPIPGTRIYAMAFGRQGKVVAVGGVGTLPWMEERRSTVTNRGTVRVFDSKSGQLWREFPVLRNGYIHSIAVAHKAPILAVAGHSWIDIWDYSKKRQLETLPMKGEVTSLSFSPDGKWLASASLWTPPTIWNISTRKRAIELPRQDGQTFGVAFTPSGKNIALAGGSFLSLYSVKGKQLWSKSVNIGFGPSYRDSNFSLAFSRDEKRLIETGYSSEIFDMKGKQLFSLPDVTSLRFGQSSIWGIQNSRLVRWNARIIYNSKLTTNSASTGD